MYEILASFRASSGELLYLVARGRKSERQIREERLKIYARAGGQERTMEEMTRARGREDERLDLILAR
jgi:hypothetical protein